MYIPTRPPVEKKSDSKNLKGAEYSTGVAVFGEVEVHNGDLAARKRRFIGRSHFVTLDDEIHLGPVALVVGEVCVGIPTFPRGGHSVGVAILMPGAVHVDEANGLHAWVRSVRNSFAGGSD